MRVKSPAVSVLSLVSVVGLAPLLGLAGCAASDRSGEQNYKILQDPTESPVQGDPGSPHLPEGSKRDAPREAAEAQPAVAESDAATQPDQPLLPRDRDVTLAGGDAETQPAKAAASPSAAHAEPTETQSPAGQTEPRVAAGQRDAAEPESPQETKHPSVIDDDADLAAIREVSPSIAGIDRTHWPKMVVRPAEGQVEHRPRYFHSAPVGHRYPESPSPVDEPTVEAAMKSALDRDRSENLDDRENAIAAVVQPLNALASVVLLPVKMVKQPPHKVHSSPATEGFVTETPAAEATPPAATAPAVPAPQAEPGPEPIEPAETTDPVEQVDP